MQVKQILAVLASTAAVAFAEGDSAVTALTKDTFNDFVGANDLVLAECKQRPTKRSHELSCPGRVAPFSTI